MLLTLKKRGTIAKICYIYKADIRGGYEDSVKWMNEYACFTLSDKEDRYPCSIHIHYIICEFDEFRIERAALQQPFARWCKAFLEGGSRRPVLRTCSR